MSRSDWLKHPKTRLIGGLIAGLAFCCVWIGYGLLESANYERQARANANEYARHTRDKVAETCVGIPQLERIKCLNDAEDAQREYEYNQSDLVAQRQSALWAYVMAAAAIFGMILSAVGVFLVWTTFLETKKSADIAVKNLDAFKRMEAPVVHARFAEAPTFYQDGDALKIKFDLAVHNDGRTIAHIIAIQFHDTAEMVYNFMLKSDGKKEIAESFDISFNEDGLIRGFIEYVAHFGLRRRTFEIVANPSEGEGHYATIHPGPVYTEEDDNFENPFN